MNEEQLDILDAFRDRTASLDMVRGETFAEVFPELAELVESACLARAFRLRRIG